MLPGPGGLRHGGDPGHLLLGQGEPEQVQVFPHPLRTGGLWEREHTVLQGEAQADLGHGDLVGGGDLEEQGVVHQPPPTQGRPGGHLDVVLPAVLNRGALKIPRVVLQLVDHGKKSAAGGQIHQVVRQEVAGADGTHLPLLIQLLQAVPDPGVQLLPIGPLQVGAGPVDQVEVQVVGPQSPEGGLKGRPGVVHLGAPEFCSEEKRLPGKPALPDGLAQRLLRLVERGGVKVAVARLDCVQKNPLLLRGIQGVAPEADGGDIHAVR